jgi:asparagine synthetase B (glutamine-hydrolysing)
MEKHVSRLFEQLQCDHRCVVCSCFQILRKAFEGYLPDNILWRQKEQFSDGVGYSW